MAIFDTIQNISTSSTANDRGSIKKFILAMMSYSKHTGQKLNNLQIATLTKQYIPDAKTSAGSVADYKNKLNSGLFDYYTLDEAKAILASFEEAEVVEVTPSKPVAPWSAAGLVYKAKAKRSPSKVAA